MNRDDAVLLALRTADRHRCHTAILYGSWARGDATPGSDVDVLCVRKGGVPRRDARCIDGVYLDAFIYPEAALATPDASMLRLVGGVVLRTRGRFAHRLLDDVRALDERGPDPLPDDERQARIVWAHKTLGRIGGQDADEGNYRRIGLVLQALEDHFSLAGKWFRGSKEAFRWLRSNAPATHQHFAAALRPDAPADALAMLVQAVYGPLDCAGPRPHSAD